jgi:hypothetical protein
LLVCLPCPQYHSTPALPAVASIPPITPLFNFLLPAFFQTVPHLGLDLGRRPGQEVPTKRTLPNQTPGPQGWAFWFQGPRSLAKPEKKLVNTNLSAAFLPCTDGRTLPSAVYRGHSKLVETFFFYKVFIYQFLHGLAITFLILLRLVPFPSPCTSNHAITRARPLRQSGMAQLASQPAQGRGWRAMMGRTAREGLQWKLHAWIVLYPAGPDRDGGGLPSHRRANELVICMSCQFDGRTGTELLQTATWRLT